MVVGESLSDSKSSITRSGINLFLNKSTRDALLRRCKIELEAYSITITNLNKSFQSPNAFAALVHSHKPDCIALDEIASMEPASAFARVFSLAETELGIPQILDPKDLLDLGGTDECSVMTYLAYFLKKGAGTGTGTAADADGGVPLVLPGGSATAARKLCKSKSQNICRTQHNKS